MPVRRHIPKRQRTSRNRLRHLIRLNPHLLPTLILLLPNLKRPQNPHDRQRQRPLRQMHAGTDAPPGPERPVVAVPDVSRLCRLAGRQVRVAHVPRRVEFAGAREELLVVVDGPDGQHDPGAGGDVVAVDLVVGTQGVRHRAVDAGREPAQRLLDDAADIGQAVEVGDGRQRGRAEVLVQLCAGGCLGGREERHGFDKGDQGVARRVGASFEGDAGDVGGGVVREELAVGGALPRFLRLGDVMGKSWWEGVNLPIFSHEKLRFLGSSVVDMLQLTRNRTTCTSNFDCIVKQVLELDAFPVIQLCRLPVKRS